MNQIKHRITLLTPFRPRRAGAGFIALILLLALFTGSVMADRVTVSTFAIPEENWTTPASHFMPQADYDLLMSMQTPGWEELTTQAYAKQITPQLPKLKAVFIDREPENRFMRHLQYSVAEASYPSSGSYQMRWNTSFWCYDPRGMVLLDFELNWRYSGTEKLTCAKRSKLLDDALIYADREARTLNIAKIQEMGSANDASAALAAQLNENAKELGGNVLTIWFTNVGVDVPITEPSPAIQAQRELLSALTPEGYLDQTARDYQAFLQENVGDFNTKMRDAIESVVNKTIYEAYMEMHGLSYHLDGNSADFTLMPAWTMRGRIYNQYRLDWKTVDPSGITVGQRHDAICKIIDSIRDEATYAAWEAEDWESLDKALKERLPMLAKAASTPALQFTVTNVALQLAPLPTDKYVHNSPQNALKAFMSAAYDQDTAQMAAILPPIELDANSTAALAAREVKLKHLAQMYPGAWTLGEPRKDPNKDNVLIIDLTFHKFNADGMGIGVVTRQVRLTQIDGKWYLLLESLQL